VSARPLVVRVEEPASGQSFVYVFSSGPVWVGASASAGLPIGRPFILDQHGIFHFDERAVRYQDLDARAGTLVDGDPVGRGEHLLTEHSRLEMGPVVLTISRREPDEPIADPRSSPFAVQMLSTMVLPPGPALPAAPIAPTSWAKPVGLHDPAPRVSGPLSALDLAMDVSLEDEDPRAYRQWGAVEDGPRPRERKPTRRGRGRGRHAASRAGLWLMAFGLFVLVVGVAGLVLQYRGLPWMPPQLAARIPPWLAALFR
jgi:hypothetical protein